MMPHRSDSVRGLVTGWIALFAASLMYGSAPGGNGLFIVAQSAAASDLVLSEFVASNENGLLDEDGDSSDWIEVHNTNLVDSIDLEGLYLTDSASNPTKWAFPSTTILPDSYLVVFASSKDRDIGLNLHTNFKLSAGGEYLGLLDADGSTVLSHYSPEYPPQSADRSYGVDGSDGQPGFFSDPSPGAENGARDDGVAVAPEPVTALPERGFYSAPVDVTLSSPTTSDSSASVVSIRYTTDGSEPTVATGTVYTVPLSIATTTILRAKAFATGSDGTILSSLSTSTHSYMFLEDVITQPASVPGFPNGLLWYSRRLQEENNSEAANSRWMQVAIQSDDLVPQDVAMDPEVVALYADEILESMTSIPSMMLTASTDDIFGADGFYFSDDGIERGCSMEILDFNNPGDNEQIDVGVEGHSKNRNKRSLRLNFRSEYGNREWETDFLKNNVPVNGDSEITTRHKTLILRAGSNRSWARSIFTPDRVSYTVDEFYRSSQIAMTGVGSHGTFVHLYFNGVYWGLYNLVERPDDDFQAAYFGGSDDSWFYTNHGNAGSAPSPRWDYLLGELLQKNMARSSNYAELQEYLNVERFADYMILNFYVGMTDWPENNWYVANRNGDSSIGPTPSEFFAWDGEYSLDRKHFPEIEDDFPVPDGAYVRFEFRNDVSGDAAPPIVRLWFACMQSKQFKDLLDERVETHTSSGGALSTENALLRWDAINAFIESAVVGESARWGDSLESLGEKYAVTPTRDVEWRNQVEKIRNLLAGNTEQFLDQYNILVSPNIKTKIFRFIYKMIPNLFNRFPDSFLERWEIIPPKNIEYYD